MDAFYVSCELQRRPELAGKPVVVAGSGPRAVVTTASYEARKYGVFSATPAARARRSCPDAIFVAPDFDHYRERSREVMEVLRAQVDTVEVVGLDEAYLDLTGFESPNAAGRRIKAAVTAMGESLRAEVADTAIKTTVIEPGMVDTPFFDNKVTGALEADDIARAVLYALSQPAHVDVNEVLVRPVNQPT